MLCIFLIFKKKIEEKKIYNNHLILKILLKMPGRRLPLKVQVHQRFKREYKKYDIDKFIWKLEENKNIGSKDLEHCVEDFIHNESDIEVIVNLWEICCDSIHYAVDRRMENGFNHLGLDSGHEHAINLIDADLEELEEDIANAGIENAEEIIEDIKDIREKIYQAKNPTLGDFTKCMHHKNYSP
jgi:hypothetical protein